MPFQIIRNDITKVKATVIVNTANPHPIIGGGTDSAIYKAAGENELLAERKKIGDILPGQAVASPAFNLSAKHIIHTVGPAWVDGNHGERDILRSCYTNSLITNTELINVFTGYVQTLDLFYMLSLCRLSSQSNSLLKPGFPGCSFSDMWNR